MVQIHIKTKYRSGHCSCVEKRKRYLKCLGGEPLISLRASELLRWVRRGPNEKETNKLKLLDE